MKKYTVILAAFAMFAFAACNKDSEKGYTLNDDGTVNITIGCTAPDNNAKQSFNGERMRIFFTAGDQIMINGDAANPFNVTPKPTSVAGTTDNMSNRASVMNVPQSDNYEFFFTAQTYTVRPNGTYEVNMLSEVNLLGNGVSNPFTNENQAWPMYAMCNDLTTLGENGVMLLNAVGVISPTIIYGPEWCDAAFATLAGVTSFNANECPDLRVEHVIIKSNQRMTGSATLNKTNPNNPYIEMDGGQWMPVGQLDQVICHVTNPQSLIPTAGEQAVLNIIGNLPIAPNVWQPTYQMDIYFQVNINGTTYYYMFETQTSQHNFATARSLRDWLAVNFQTVGNTLPTPNADGSITFGNGTLSAPSLVNLWN